NQVQTWINGSGYDVRGDLDLDGDVDTSDKSTVQGSPYAGASGGRGCLSTLIQNRFGYAGSTIQVSNSYNERNRTADTQLGRWTQRDPINNVDGLNLYELVGG